MRNNTTEHSKALMRLIETIEKLPEEKRSEAIRYAVSAFNEIEKSYKREGTR